MANINQLREVDLSKIGNKNLANKVQELLAEFKDETLDSIKELPEAISSISTLYKLVEKYSPEAISKPKKVTSSNSSADKRKTTPSDTKEKKETAEQKKEAPKPSEKKEKKAPTKPSESKTKQKVSKADQEAILKELENLEPTLENCRRVVREHQAKKREAKGPKPKPTRHTQLKNKLLSIIGLIPEKLMKDEDLLEQTEEVLLDTHSKLIELWGMDKKKAQSGAAAIEEKFDSIEEKKAKEERKKLAKRWKNQLPDIDSLMRKEWKESEGLENEAKEILDDIKESIKLFEQDAKKAKDYLSKRYSKEELERHLPDFIIETLFSE